MATSRASLIAMLDPQAQMSINKEQTGTASYTRPTATGTRVTAQPTVVSNGVTEDVATVMQGQTLTPDTVRATEILSARAPSGPQPTSTSTVRVGPGGTTGGSTTTTTRPPDTPETPETPTGPDAPTAPDAPGGAEALSGYTEDEISAALASLEAQYGMNRAQLLADQTQAGAQYRLLLAQLERGRVQGIETATNDAVRRGIYRSGILGENIADVETQTLEGRAQAEQGLQARQQATDAQLRNLEAMQQAQAAQIEAGLRRQYAQTLMEAGINPGGYNPNGVGAPAAVPGGTLPPVMMPGAPAVNTQGVGAQSPGGLLPTEVASQQAAPEQQAAPAPAPATTNVAPAYQDPRAAELAMQQYMAMLAAGGPAPVTQSQPGYSPGGGYRVY